jgi:transcriptional regulator GlxA family with amidase domain
MTDTTPTHAPRLERLRTAVDLVAASAIAVTHIAGAIGTIAALRRRSARCR